MTIAFLGWVMGGGDVVVALSRGEEGMSRGTVPQSAGDAKSVQLPAVASYPGADEERIAMAPFAAIVFDLDGTLVDSVADIRMTLNGILAEIGRPPLSLPAVTAMIGDGPGKLLERALTATGELPERDETTGLIARFVARYDAAPVTHTRPYPGAAETLGRLRAGGARLGVCTNKPEGATRAVLAALDLAPLFDAVVGSGTINGVQKPDPRVLVATLAELGIAEHDAVMVGDATPDVGVARAAGVPVVLRAGGYTLKPATALGADAVFTHYPELPGVLASVRAQRR
jgi:phosphoglycolate phosphatase